MNNELYIADQAFDSMFEWSRQFFDAMWDYCYDGGVGAGSISRDLGFAFLAF